MIVVYKYELKVYNVVEFFVENCKGGGKSMNNENNNNNIGIFVFIGLCILVVLLLVGMFGGNSTSTKSKTQSNYEKSLYNAYDKKKNGGTLTKEEQKAWNDYKEWERKNY